MVLLRFNGGNIYLALHLVDDIIGYLLLRLDVHAAGVDAGLVCSPVIGTCRLHNGGTVIVLTANLQVDVYRRRVGLFHGLFAGRSCLFGAFDGGWISGLVDRFTHTNPPIRLAQSTVLLRCFQYSIFGRN